MTLQKFNVNRSPEQKAAHCIASPEVSQYSIQYASTVISNTSPNVVAVQQLIKHERFSPSNQYINDIGLVRMAATINVSLRGFRVKLPVLDLVYSTGTPAVLSGWGVSTVRTNRSNQKLTGISKSQHSNC